MNDIALKQTCACGAVFDMMVESGDWLRMNRTLAAWNERHRECQPVAARPALPAEAEGVAGGTGAPLPLRDLTTCER